MSKPQLIAKLEIIAKLYNTTIAIQNKMDRFQPADTYARQIVVPPFPGNYKDAQEREAWKKSIHHERENAVEIAAATHKKYRYPKEPAKPTLREFVPPINATEKSNQEKYGCLSKLGLGVAIFFFLGIFFGDVISNGALPATLVIIALGAGVFLLFKTKVDKSKAVVDQERAVALEEYNQQKEKIMAAYAAAVKAYESDCAAYETTSRAFLQEYRAWRPIYLKHVQEEAVIAQQLEADRKAEVNRIYAEEYAPVEKALTEYNDLVTAQYLPVIDTLIDLLKSGRADDLKEAINLYEDIVYREKELQLAREREAHRQHEEQMRLDAQERQHQEQMKFAQEQERQRQKEAKEQMEMQERQHKAEMKQRETEERNRQKEVAASRQKRCSFCARSQNCSMRNFDGAYNCTAFVPRS